MHLTPNRLALVMVTLALATTLVLLGPRHAFVWAAALALLALALVVVVVPVAAVRRLEESERIQDLALTRRAELVRGTSLRLREMGYRYSVRHDERGRHPFSARVNQIQLGFIPVIITDNETDAQGVGFVAFIHDGHRWRGPGLPCSGSADDALAHAARHVEPLRDVEDSADTRADGTRFDADADSESDHGDDDDDSRWDTGSGWEDDSEPGDGGART